MNKWLKILLGVVSVVGLIIGYVFYLTSGMVDAADAFFNAVKQKDLASARSYLAEDFKASTDENALEQFLSKSAIMGYKEASWSNRQLSGGRGELSGSLTTETGGVVPIKIVFVKENGAWKIYALEKPAAGLQPEKTSPSMPGKAEQMALVKQSMHDFVVAVEKKSMDHFRGTVSQLWQKQVTTEELNHAFQSIIDSNANWSILETFEPSLSSDAKIDENGVLLLTGRYQTEPNVVFEQQYVYEGIAWKLVGFSIRAE